MATAAQIAYLDLQLQAAGKIKGDSSTTSLGRKRLIEVWAFLHEVSAPRDPATGHATGRRIEKPIRWTTPVGTASAARRQRDGREGDLPLLQARPRR